MNTNNRVFEIGVLGGGINSAVGIAHFSAINLSNKFKIVAGSFSRNSEINRQTALSYNVSPERVYPDYQSLIKNEKGKIDGLIILTPTNQHASQVMEGIKAGIPIICEKALAESVNETTQILDLIKAKSGFLSVIYNYLGYPMVRELKQIIQSGKIGKVQNIQIEMPQEGYKKVQDDKPAIPQSWRLKDDFVPMLSLDLGVHLHMMIKYLTNEVPLKVVATSHSFGNFPEVIDDINCMIWYSNEMLCNMWYSKMAIGNRNGMRVRIFGETGAAEWYQVDPEILRLSDRKGNIWTMDRGSPDAVISNLPRYTRFKVGHPAGFIEALANYYEDIAEALLIYKKSKTTVFNDCFGIKEAFEGIKLFEAIQKSDNLKPWVKV